MQSTHSIKNENSKDASQIKNLWTVKDAANFLKLNPETIRIKIRCGEIPATKVGRVWRIDPTVILNKFTTS